MPLVRDRRRRVTADDLLLTTGDEAPNSAGDALPKASGQRYAPAARREHQPRLIDILPARALPFTLFFGVGLILIASLLLAYTWLPDLAAYVPRDSLAALDLANERSLATWFASLVLLTNMQMALLVYSVRRHRVDDYHGRYRIWLAVAVASLAASVDLATGLNALLKVALAPLARWCGLADHHGIWLTLGCLATYLAVRLILETRRAPLALATFVSAAAVFAAPLAMRFGWLSIDLPEHVALFRVGTHVLGCLLILTGTMLFGRHVLLDVEGKIKARKAKATKPAKVKKVKTKAADEENEKPATAGKTNGEQTQKSKPRTDVDPSPKPASPLGSRIAAMTSKPAIAAATAADDDDEEEEDGSPDLRNMSRAERKRLKREAKLARRAA